MFHGESVGGGNPIVPIGVSKTIKYFYAFEQKTHPDLATQTASAKAAINALWYYSEEGKGSGSAGLSGFQWEGCTIKDEQGNPLKDDREKITSTVVVKVGDYAPESRKVLGRCTPSPVTITFYQEAIKEATIGAPNTSVPDYIYVKQGTIMVVKDPTKTAVEETRTLSIAIVPTKYYVALVAHIWRHELRHGEQYLGLARLNAGDITDRDGDKVCDFQEDANNTTATQDYTWPNFPVSSGSNKHDQEIDSELRAVNERGVSSADWAMVRWAIGDPGGENDERRGTNWDE